MKDLPKAYNPKDVEDNIYRRWEESGFFNPDKLEEASDRFWNAQSFSMAMPLPNATGELHAGHAVMLTLEDIITRHARLSGKKTLWLPGTDHAAIATNYVVERQIWETEKKTRHQIGREEFLQRVNEFVERTRGRIQYQIRKLGSSCDWSREKYTLSPELSRAVRVAFKKIYDAGLIYRGDRIVSWCPRCGTTLADDEVISRKQPGKMYYIRYPLAKSREAIMIATVRPDTLLADTGIAVHPNDSRYKKYVGQTVMLPLVNREIPIVADKLVDPAFGTGALKVTPGHDAQDFEIAERHGLEVINLFDENGRISSPEATDHGFEDFAGLTADQAREKIVQELTDQGFLEKTEALLHNIGVCYRCETAVEPIVSKQWFVNVNAKCKVQSAKFQKLLKIGTEASFKEIALAAVKSGAITITPKRFEKVYFEWMENLRDWNISRQIWFGHQIPVYSCDACAETIVEVEPPLNCPTCNSTKITQDPDTLDTWFSSSLWTFSALGWPEETSDLATYHPTNLMETGYDILFFWVARMIIMTGFVMEDIPFRQVYLHGLVRDIHGMKMSKSRGNVMNPLEMSEKYGTDALRLSLVLGTTPGNDMRISETKIKSYRNFVNKLWNISRYILAQTKNLKSETINLESTSLADRWIMEEVEILIADVQKHFANLQFALAGEALYDFTWNKFADWYLEISKIEGSKEAILHSILRILLKLWHPFIPFITEHLWSQLSREMLMVQEYPKDISKVTPRGGRKSKVSGQFAKLQALITGLRNLRAEYRQPPREIFAAYLELPEGQEWIKTELPIVEKLARVKINFEKIPADKKMPYFLWDEVPVHLIIPHFDPKQERQVAEQELKDVEARIAKLEEPLGRKDFLKKAPAEVVEKIKSDSDIAKTRASQLKEKIKSLK